MARAARDVVFVDGVRTPFGKAGPTGLYAETKQGVSNPIRQPLKIAVRDAVRAPDDGSSCRMALTDVPIEECVRTLQRLGYHGAITVEHEPETFDPTDDLRAMRAQLEGWLA